MVKMADYGLTPDQYHGGLDKLWTATGLSGPQDTDIFTIASEMINELKKDCDRLRNELDVANNVIR